MMEAGRELELDMLERDTWANDKYDLSRKYECRVEDCDRTCNGCRNALLDYKSREISLLFWDVCGYRIEWNEVEEFFFPIFVVGYLAHLAPEQAEIFALIWGFDGGGPRTLAEVARLKRRSASYIYQVHNRCMRKLRHPLFWRTHEFD